MPGSSQPQCLLSLASAPTVGGPLGMLLVIATPVNFFYTWVGRSGKKIGKDVLSLRSVFDPGLESRLPQAKKSTTP